ncbi:MAG: hypothetical protein GEV08_21000 [Acidimicrobiia bacterium]|nr:hypothetical protein [Acidimicrobiia bacterium]
MLALEDTTTATAAELPWPAAIILCLVFVGTGVMAWQIGRRGGRYKLPMNRWVGIRTRSTFRNENTWFAAHYAAAPFFKAAGAAGVLGGLMFLLRPQGTLLGVTLGVIAVETMGMVVATTLGVRAANRTR